GRGRPLHHRRAGTTNRAVGADHPLLLRRRSGPSQWSHPGRLPPVRRRGPRPPGDGPDPPRPRPRPGDGDPGPRPGVDPGRRRDSPRRRPRHPDPHPPPSPCGPAGGGEAQHDPGGDGAHAQAGQAVRGGAQPHPHRLLRRGLRRPRHGPCVRTGHAVGHAGSAGRSDARTGRGVDRARRARAGAGVPPARTGDVRGALCRPRRGPVPRGGAPGGVRAGGGRARGDSGVRRGRPPVPRGRRPPQGDRRRTTGRVTRHFRAASVHRRAVRHGQRRPGRALLAAAGHGERLARLPEHDAGVHVDDRGTQGPPPSL
ncbi:MAG: Transcriptional regulator, MerR family, partial [uncultured Acidimicrobiales bacterium]